MPSLIDSFTCTLSMSTLTRHLLKHQQKNSMDHVLIISYANANECCLSGAHKFILIWRTLCLVCSSTQSIHKITALTHKQIQFELYYFHYNICLHTDAIYVLLWNVAVALGSEQPRGYIHTHAHRTSLESKPFADGVCVSMCVSVDIKSQQHICWKTPINFTIVDNLLSNYMLKTWAQLMRMHSKRKRKRNQNEGEEAYCQTVATIGKDCSRKS